MLMAPEDMMAVGQRNDRINDNLFGLIIRCHSCMSNFLKSNISIWTVKHMKKKEYLHEVVHGIFDTAPHNGAWSWGRQIRKRGSQSLFISFQKVLVTRR